MLIKLDGGEYINPDYIKLLWGDDGAWFAGMNHGEPQQLTTNDKDRILEAVGPDDHDITIMRDGNEPFEVIIDGTKYYLTEAEDGDDTTK